MATTINANNTDGVVITPDTSGELELQANGVTKAKVTANGLQDANGNSLRGGSFRNLIINGDMRIAQRGTSESGISNASSYLLDRFLFGNSNIGTWTQSQDSDVPSGQGFVKSIKLNCTASDTPSGTELLSVQQRIEAQNLQHLKYGTSNAEDCTVSFWVKSNKTGTYTFAIYQFDGTAQGISKTYTINSADTWEYKTITIEGNTGNGIDNDNGAGLGLYWILSAGSDRSSSPLQTSWGAFDTNAFVSSSQVNLADSTSNYINITGLQLEIGEGSSNFEFLPYDVQLQRCQRYYWKYVEGMSKYISMASLSNSSTVQTILTFPTTMRANPTLDHSTGTNYYGYYGTAGWDDFNSLTQEYTSNSSIGLYSLTGVSGTAGHGVAMATRNASAYVAFSAEL